MGGQDVNNQVQMENDRSIPWQKRCVIKDPKDPENYINVYINFSRQVYHIRCNGTQYTTPVPPENRFVELSSKQNMSTNRQNDTCTNNFDRLPDEVVLNIFQRLSQNQLCSVALVCRRFKQIVDDESLWEMMDASHSVIGPDCLSRIMDRQVKILKLVKSKIRSPRIWRRIRVTHPDHCWRLVHLDLTEARISENNLISILSKCQRLKTLSLKSVAVNDDVFLALSDNRYLEVLNLQMATGITTRGLQILLADCKKLKELNLAYTSLNVHSIDYICKNIPSSLETFNISGCRNLLQDKHVKQIVNNCPHIRELDLSNCSSITADVVPILFTSTELKLLNFRGCDRINHASLFILRRISEGIYLNIHTYGFCKCGEV